MILEPGVSIQVNIVSDREMLQIGRKYKGKNYATDVLTFNYFNSEGYKKGDLYGEIYINIDAAIRQAGELGHSVEEEVSLLLKHAMMHLQGVHHKGDL